MMEKAFDCMDCAENYGFEQPAYVIPTADHDSLPGACLVTSKPEDSTCRASHPVTKRLCPCVPRNMVMH